MYTYKTSTSNKPGEGLAGLARALAMPHEYPPTRYPSFPALERTATMAFNYTNTVAVTTTRAVLIRDPVFPFWAERKLNGVVWTSNFMYRWPKTSGTITQTDLTGTASNANYEMEIDPTLYSADTGTDVGSFAGTTLVISANAGSTVRKPDWVFPPLGVDAGVKDSGSAYTYVPAGYTLSVVVSFDVSPMSPASATATAYIDLLVWDSYGKENRLSTLSIGIPNGSVCVVNSDVLNTTSNYWVRPGAFNIVTSAAASSGAVSSVSNTTVSLVVSAGTCALTNRNLVVTGADITSMVPTAVSKEFVNSILPWRDTKVTAASVLCTNVTKALDKEGTVLAGRVAPRTTDYWNWNRGTLEVLHPAEKCFIGLEKGFYTYAPPAEDMATFRTHILKIQSYYTVPDSTAKTNIMPVFALDNTSMANAMLFSDPDGGTTLALNVDWHIEFRSNSTLFEIGMSGLTLEMFHQAQIQLSAVGYFFGNEDHWDRIKRFTKTIAGWASKMAPAISMVNPLAGKATSAVADLVLSHVPKQMVQPTALSIPTNPRPAVSGPNTPRTPVKVVVKSPKAALTKAQRKKLAKKAKGG